MTRALVTALILAPLFSSVAQGLEGPERLMGQVASDFIGIASRSWQDFSIREHRSKTEDKRAFLSKSFEKELFPAGASVGWKELHVKEEGAFSSLHLGLIAVTFQDQKEATRVHARLAATKQPFLEGTKILTRYKAMLYGNTVLILYSETFSHQALRDFFATVTLQP